MFEPQGAIRTFALPSPRFHTPLGSGSDAAKVDPQSGTKMRRPTAAASRFIIHPVISFCEATGDRRNEFRRLETIADENRC
jgi:hypothetical protein